MIDPELQKLVKRIPMEDVVEMTGAGPIRNRKILSIYQDEKTPSLHVYDYDFFDFSTGRGGDQVTFVMDYMGVPYGAALRYLARIGDVSARPPRERRKREDVDMTSRFKAEPGGDTYYDQFVEMIERKWPTLTVGEILTMSRSRVVESKGKHTEYGALWTPHYSWDGSRITGIKIRALDRLNKSAVTGSIFTSQLYQIPYGRAVVTDRIIIVEGESDAWALQKAVGWDNGTVVYGLPSGAMSWKDEFADQLIERHGKMQGKIYLALDDDNAGAIGTRAVRKGLAPIPVHEIEVPGGRIAEGLASGWNPLETLTQSS